LYNSSHHDTLKENSASYLGAKRSEAPQESETLRREVDERGPLREMLSKKLNSPQRSPQRPSPIEDQALPFDEPLSNTDSKSVGVLSEILAAKRASRPISLPNSVDTDGQTRRKRTLGRAASLGLHPPGTDKTPELEEPVQIPEPLLASQVVAYGDAADGEKRKKLLADIIPTTKAADERKDLDLLVEEVPAVKRKTPARTRAKGKRKH
jgi:hypothetical protein